MTEQERLVKVEQIQEQMLEDIRGIKKDLKASNDLIASVKEIAVELKYLRSDTNDINQRVKTLEKEPAQDYSDIKKSIRTTITTTIIGIIIGAILEIIITTQGGG